MKTLQAINREIKAYQEAKSANFDARKNANADFMRAHEAGDHDAARLASEEFAKLKKTAERINARGKVLTNNYNYILVETGKNALAEILKKYDGKQYGASNAEKICDEMHEKGFSCCLPANHYLSKIRDSIAINERETSGRGVEAWTKNRAQIIDENNTIHAKAVAELVNPYKYIENIETYLNKIERLTAETRKAFDAATAKAHELNEFAVDGLEWLN